MCWEDAESMEESPSDGGPVQSTTITTPPSRVDTEAAPNPTRADELI
ncbi:hypothetical protein M758_UG201700 [Ceratodon purpureus]|nr:hypothetical protein M758_UG201700 [Ceratodon purpureus]